MVDGVGKNNLPSQLKLKGKDGQTINLDNLKGLQKTEQNKALFDMYDKNKDGKIDNDEAIVMKKNLQSLAGGNNIISQREIKTLFGDNNKAAFDALSKLADQQAAFDKGVSEYTEVSGNTTTHVYKGFSNEHSYTYTTTKNQDGSTTTIDPDGNTIIDNKNGSRAVISQDGTTKLYKSSSDSTPYKITNPDGSVIEHSPDGNKTTIKNSSGQIVETTELKDNQEVQTKFEYKDGYTVAREYNITNGQNELSSIIVTGKGTDADGKSYTSEIHYGSEEDMQNNRPLSETRNKGLPTEVNIKYAYDDKGNIKIEITNAAGDVDVKYTDAEGNTIQGNQFDAPEKYTVQKGQTITQIATDMLKNQGIENPTPEQLTAAKKELLEANSDQVHTMKTGQYKGNKYFYANAEINVPKFEISSSIEDKVTYTAGELNNVDVVAKRVTKEAKELRQELQKVYGDDFEVTYSPDGQLEIRTKDGELLAEETKEANAMLATTDEEDLASIMRDADTIKKDNQIDQKEYNQYINNMLSKAGFGITDANRAQVQQLIDNSFSSLDGVSSDGKISQEELQKRAKVVIQKLTDDLGKIDISATENTSASEPSPQMKTFTKEQSQTYFENHKYVRALQDYVKKHGGSVDESWSYADARKKLSSMPSGPEKIAFAEDMANKQSIKMIENDLNNFKSLISNWEDGRVHHMELNGTYVTATEKIVDGVPKFQIGDKLYDVGITGFPILDKALYEKSLRVFNKGIEIPE